MRFSVKLRVTLWYTLVMIITSFVVMTAMVSISRDMIERDVRARIIRTVKDNSRVAMFPRPPKIDDERAPMPFYNRGVHMVLYDSERNIIKGQIPFDLGEVPEFCEEVTEVSYNGNLYLVYDEEVMSPKSESQVFVRGVVSVTDETYALNTIIKNNIILTAILIFIAGIGGYVIISRAFVPVNKISKTAKEISESSDLSRRINIGKGKDEISGLANTFDEMLDKIEKTFENEKQFTSDASHELRTPVAVILSECEYMDECAKTEDDFKESAKSVKRQADKMSKLISELLMISRMDKNSVFLNKEETDVSELLMFVCDEQEEIRETKVCLERKIKENVIADVDRSLVARMFINLVSNAYQYIGEGDKIVVSLDETDNEIIFSVCDNGIGIDSENTPRIWKRFYQVDSSRTSNENNSMGLGLSMVKHIADAHKGIVDVQSELGKGSIFTVKIPKK